MSFLLSEALFFLSATTAALVTIGVFLFFAFYKVVKSASKKSTVFEFAGKEAVAIDEISAAKEGFVLFHGEHWKATSEYTIVPKQRVKITSRTGLTLTVEPMKDHR